MKGFIEVTHLGYKTKVLVNIKHIYHITSENSNAVIVYGLSNQQGSLKLAITESYDDVLKLIESAQK